MPNPTFRKAPAWLGWLTLAVLAAAMGFWLSMYRDDHGPAVHATVLTPTKPVPDFRLLDDRGQPFTRDRLKNHWSLLFFGYTHCPDVCPSTLTILNQAVKRIHATTGDDTAPQVIFVSVDPGRDTVDRMHDYVTYFNPRFIGVTGDAGEIDRLTRALGILHAKEPQKGGGYLVDHSAAILLADPHGGIRALFSVPHHPDQIAADYLVLSRRYR